MCGGDGGWGMCFSVACDGYVQRGGRGGIIYLQEKAEGVPVLPRPAVDQQRPGRGHGPLHLLDPGLGDGAQRVQHGA